MPQATTYTSPVKWNLGHTTWFFEAFVLSKYAPNYAPFHSQFGFVFNSYYQALGKHSKRNQRGLYTRPTVSEVFAYRAHVDIQMHTLLHTAPNQSVLDIIELGVNHEQQHQELLLTDLKYLFSLNPLNPIYNPTLEPNLAPNLDLNLDKNTTKPDWIAIPKGEHHIGHQGNEFCYDNECARFPVLLGDYQIATTLVTNGDFITFIEQGGYDNPRYWLDDGWHWLNNESIRAPLYWQQTAGEWWHYTLAGLQQINPQAVLTHVSFYEANAFARFKNQRLPTEFEWEAASSQFNWGMRWEHTASAYLPYPNFTPSTTAVGEYNAKFMSNQMVLRGASTLTVAGHSRNTYRNFFHPQMQWQYAGIRLAK